MDTSSRPSTPANGLITYFSVITSPVAAFTQLRQTPMWGWAAIAGIALFFIATMLSLPEQMKIAHVQQALAIAQMPADQQAAVRDRMATMESVTRISIVAVSVLAPWIVWFISSVVFVLGAAISGAGARFALAWVASVNAAAVAFVGAVVNSVILAIRGPAAISAPIDAYALPSLAMFVQGNPKLLIFLASYNLVNVIYYIVSAIGMEYLLGVKRQAAIATVVIYSLVTAGLAAAFAK